MEQPPPLASWGLGHLWGQLRVQLPCLAETEVQLCRQKPRSWEEHPFCFGVFLFVPSPAWVRLIRSLWKAVVERPTPASHQHPLSVEKGNWAGRGGEAFSLGTLQFYWNISNAVKSSWWVISRLVLPIAVSTKVPIYSKIAEGSSCAKAMWCCAAAQLSIASRNISDAQLSMYKEITY